MKHQLLRMALAVTVLLFCAWPRASIAQAATAYAVVAWGLNDSGQTTVPFAAQSGVTAIAAGWEHTVALKSDGSAVAWGDNDYGETTVPVAAQSGVTAVAAGGGHTVALKNDGSVVAWGLNDYGQTTIPLAAQSGVSAIAAGSRHTVALRNDGSIVAWGQNVAGETTVPVAAQSGVTAIAAGEYYTVALKADGTVVGWGRNDWGQTTVPVAAQSGVSAIAAGWRHTVALKSDGSVVAWGYNESGQVTGTPATDGYPYSATASPVTPGGQVLSGVAAIAAGGHYTVALKIDGTVVAWGDNYFGQVTGTPTTNAAIARPVTLEGQVLSGVTAIAAGMQHTVALKNDGTVVAWGSIGTASPVTLEGQVLSGVTAIAAGNNHTVAVIGGVQLLPALKARLNGNELILSWPTNAVGFTLQSTLDLTPPVTWLDSTSVPAVIGAYFTVTNTTSGGARLFRLRKM